MGVVEITRGIDMEPWRDSLRDWTLDLLLLLLHILASRVSISDSSRAQKSLLRAAERECGWGGELARAGQRVGEVGGGVKVKGGDALALAHHVPLQSLVLQPAEWNDDETMNNEWQDVEVLGGHASGSSEGVAKRRLGSVASFAVRENFSFNVPPTSFSHQSRIAWSGGSTQPLQRSHFKFGTVTCRAETSSGRKHP